MTAIVLTISRIAYHPARYDPAVSGYTPRDPSRLPSISDYYSGRTDIEAALDRAPRSFDDRKSIRSFAKGDDRRREEQINKPTQRADLP